MDNELDLRILKALTTDKISALTYVNKFDHTLFSNEFKLFGKICTDYINTYRSPPTERTLIEFQKDPSNTPIIESTWQDLELIDYDIREYSFDLDKLKKRHQHRKIEEIRERAADEENVEDYDKFIKELSLKINEVVRLDLGRSYVHESAGDYVDKFREVYENIKNNPESINRIKTGFSAYDALTGGIAPSELIIVGGETGAGKSMLLNNMSKNIWLNGNSIESDLVYPGKNLLYFSLEMPVDMCFNRFLASLANVKMSDLVKGNLNEDDQESVNIATDFIKNYQEAGYFFNIVDFPRGLTINDMEALYEEAMLRFIPDVIVVDYLSLMSVDNSMAREQDWLKVGYLAAALHEFARTYNIPVITAAQLTDIKRGAQSAQAEQDKRIGTHRFGRSSLILHNVNAAIQIESRPHEADLFDLIYHLIKNRNGPLGCGTLIKDFAKASLVDVPYEDNLNKDVSPDISELIRKFKEKGTEEQIN